MTTKAEVGTAGDGAFPTEKARRRCEERQAACPHEWALSTQRNGLLLWRFHQDDCPRCLKMWMLYWRCRVPRAAPSEAVTETREEEET